MYGYFFFFIFFPLLMINAITHTTTLQIGELKQTVSTARDRGINPRAMVIINPGNPTGQCLSEDNIAEVININIKLLLLELSTFIETIDLIFLDFFVIYNLLLYKCCFIVFILIFNKLIYN